MVDLVRTVSSVPTAIGFGISTPEQAKEMAKVSDGAIVGSAIVKIIAAYGTEARKPLMDYVREMKAAVMEAAGEDAGEGETLACGTGACASAYACFESGKIKNSVKADLDGGSLKIDIDEKTRNLYMTGDAVTVYEGVIDF